MTISWHLLVEIGKATSNVVGTLGGILGALGFQQIRQERKKKKEQTAASLRIMDFRQLDVGAVGLSLVCDLTGGHEGLYIVANVGFFERARLQKDSSGVLNTQAGYLYPPKFDWAAPHRQIKGSIANPTAAPRLTVLMATKPPRETAKIIVEAIPQLERESLLETLFH